MKRILITWLACMIVGGHAWGGSPDKGSFWKSIGIVIDGTVGKARQISYQVHAIGSLPRFAEDILVRDSAVEIEHIRAAQIRGYFRGAGHLGFWGCKSDPRARLDDTRFLDFSG